MDGVGLKLSNKLRPVQLLQYCSGAGDSCADGIGLKLSNKLRPVSRVVLDDRLASIARHSFGSTGELDESARTPSRQQSMNLHKNPGLASL